jgi:hypothetical protein
MTSEGGREPERKRRIGLNEGVFREINERVKELADEFGIGDEPLDLVCECGEADCAQGIRLARADYERVRSDSRLFAIAAGHEKKDIEEVVETRDGYSVVRKREGEAARAAEETDPRSD